MGWLRSKGSVFWPAAGTGSRSLLGVTGPVAQLVEHRTFNAVVAGSIPARLTIKTKGFIESLHFVCARCLCPKSHAPYLAGGSRAARPVALADEGRRCGNDQTRAWFYGR
jgi:hypothetical protein